MTQPIRFTLLCLIALPILGCGNPPAWVMAGSGKPAPRVKLLAMHFAGAPAVPPADPTAFALNVKDHGAIGDGKADDTQALQAVLDLFSGKQRSGRIDFPSGTYRITAPLVYRGTDSYTIRLAGEVACAGPSGSAIKYEGPPNKPVLEISGGLDVTIEHLAIDAAKAQFGIYIHEDRANGTGVSNLLLERVVVGIEGNRPKSACVSLGVNPDGTSSTFQCDDIVIRGCKFFGGECGVATGGNNVKNFYVHTTVFSTAVYGFSFGGSGTCVLRDSVFANNSGSDVYAQIGNLLIDSCESEGSAMLLKSAGWTYNAANATVRNCQWYGATGPDDVVIEYQGSLRLEADQLSNTRTDRSLPRIKLTGGLAPGSLVSEQTFYRWARSDYTDGRGRPLFLGGGYENDLMKYSDRASWLRCFADYGGDGGSLVRMRAR